MTPLLPALLFIHLALIVEGLDLNLGRFLQRSKPEEPPKSEFDKLLVSDKLKPWRGPKPKYLKIEYRPWKDSWKERYRSTDDETIYLYSIPSPKNSWDRTRVEDVWFFPWLCK